MECKLSNVRSRDIGIVNMSGKDMPMTKYLRLIFHKGGYVDEDVSHRIRAHG